MNRLDFLKEVKNSLFETVKAACAPLVEDKLEKLDHSIDLLSQLQWWHVANEAASNNTIEQKFIDGRSLLLVHANHTIRAFNGACTACNQLLHVFQITSTCKCMNCDQEYILAGSEKSYLQEYPMKRRDDGYYVGLKKRKNV